MNALGQAHGIDMSPPKIAEFSGMRYNYDATGGHTNVGGGGENIDPYFNSQVQNVGIKLQGGSSHMTKEG